MSEPQSPPQSPLQYPDSHQPTHRRICGKSEAEVRCRANSIPGVRVSNNQIPYQEGQFWYLDLPRGKRPSPEAVPRRLEFQEPCTQVPNSKKRKVTPPKKTGKKTTHKPMASLPSTNNSSDVSEKDVPPPPQKLSELPSSSQNSGNGSLRKVVVLPRQPQLVELIRQQQAAINQGRLTQPPPPPPPPQEQELPSSPSSPLNCLEAFVSEDEKSQMPLDNQEPSPPPLTRTAKASTVRKLTRIEIIDFIRELEGLHQEYVKKHEEFQGILDSSYLNLEDYFLLTPKLLRFFPSLSLTPYSTFNEK